MRPEKLVQFRTREGADATLRNDRFAFDRLQGGGDRQPGLPGSSSHFHVARGIACCACPLADHRAGSLPYHELQAYRFAVPWKEIWRCGHYLGCARCGHEVVQHEFLEIHQQQGGIKGDSSTSSVATTSGWWKPSSGWSAQARQLNSALPASTGWLPGKRCASRTGHRRTSDYRPDYLAGELRG